MTTETVKERNLGKQMGCMAGLFQIFDRHQILAGKRFSSTKRLPTLPAFETLPEPVCPVETGSAKCPKKVMTVAKEVEAEAEAVEVLTSSPLPLPIFNLKDERKSSWRFYRERPRLSLDSRATTDAMGGLHPKGGRRETSDGFQQSSPGVIAKLMGLEPLPNSSVSETERGPELRRSASESRASRELFPSRFIANKAAHSFSFNNGMKDPGFADLRDQSLKSLNTACFNPPSPFSRQSFFDSGDIFLGPKQTVSIYAEMEKRFKRKGMDEPSRDVETLKQILEALQLKGLLHSTKTADRHRIFVYDESPIVVMKSSRLPTSTPSPIKRRNNGIGCYSLSNSGNQGCNTRRNHYSFAGENSPPVSPSRDRNARSPRASRSSSPNERNKGNANVKCSNSLVKPKPLTVEIRKKQNQSPENRRISPAQSPKDNASRISPEPTANNGSPRCRKPTAKIEKKVKNTSTIGEEDGSSSISESSFTASSDFERWKIAECREGKNRMERCDKLLESIAEMNAADMQPSPVSVLDSCFSFHKEEAFTPSSPLLTKRNLDFKDFSGEMEEGEQSPIVPLSGDGDYEYISDILRASQYLANDPHDPDVFKFLEKWQYLKGKDTSRASRLHRKLIFDATGEILERNRRLPPWKTVSYMAKPLLEKVWSEFQRIRDQNGGDGDDPLDVMIGVVLKKDLGGEGTTAGWDDPYVEMSEGVLDTERLVFKDLISEMIHDVAATAWRSGGRDSRRKLVF